MEQRPQWRAKIMECRRNCTKANETTNVYKNLSLEKLIALEKRGSKRKGAAQGGRTHALGPHKADIWCTGIACSVYNAHLFAAPTTKRISHVRLDWAGRDAEVSVTPLS